MIEAVIADENISFSSYVVQACIFSLKNLDDDKKKRIREIEQSKSILD